MNYMDYVDDRAMFMFTAGQLVRVNACLDGPRASILTAAVSRPNPSRSRGGMGAEPPGRVRHRHRLCALPQGLERVSLAAVGWAGTNPFRGL